MRYAPCPGKTSRSATSRRFASFHRKTVREWPAQPGPPLYGPRIPQPSKLAPVDPESASASVPASGILGFCCENSATSITRSSRTIYIPSVRRRDRARSGPFFGGS